MTEVDHYSVAELGLAVCLQSLGATYFPGDTKRATGWQVSDDDTVLTLGGDYFIVYRPGACPVTPIARGIYDYNWEVVLDLYVRYVSYKLSWAQFRAYRAAIVNLLNTHQTLNGTNGVHGVTFRSDARPQYFRFTGTPETAIPNFLIQTTQVVVVQRVIYATGDI